MNKISEWIKEYAKDKHLVVGVSGGIDSAVTSTLCAETGLQTHVLNINIDSNADNQNLAKEHIIWLKEKYDNVNPHYINLSNTYNSFLNDISISNPHANANTKSRLRMVALYQYAAMYGGIVAGTGNKVEDFGVGFFTKYGDGGVDISPIANFYKSEVREIAVKLGILQEIIEAKPTDGLWDDNRTDEDQIGATYEELESVMKGKESSSKVKEIYNKFHTQNKHKMQPIPVYRGGF